MSNSITGLNGQPIGKSWAPLLENHYQHVDLTPYSRNVYVVAVNGEWLDVAAIVQFRREDAARVAQGLRLVNGLSAQYAQAKIYHWSPDQKRVDEFAHAHGQKVPES